jgi:thiopurine S-methyltransferase
MNESEEQQRPLFADINRHWLQRWEQGDTGWHHQAFNRHLIGCWPALAAATGCRVLVPLCGKSRDMVWLAEQGHRVLGVELSPVAVATFFEEQQLIPRREVRGGLESWQAGDFEILCGDMFELQSQHVQGIAAVYDRASLVAFSPEQRDAYAELLGRLLPAGCRMLLVAMDYPQLEMTGPPYAVTADEMARLFADRFDIELLDSLDLLAETERYAERGLSRLLEQVYRLVRR